MGQILHGSATTTHAVRAAIQRSQASIAQLSSTYSVNPKTIAAQFLRNLVEHLPYKVRTILTDNGIRFTNRRSDKSAFEHIFDRVCRENGLNIG